MQIVNRPDTLALLPWSKLATALDIALAERAAGKVSCPLRNRLDIAGGVLLTMPAANQTTAVVKTVTVNSSNASHGDLNVVQADVLVMDSSTGKRLLLLDGDAVTERRTATLSVLAWQRIRGSSHIDWPKPKHLLCVGAGVQARAHIDAFLSLTGLDNITIACRTPSSAQPLANHCRQNGIHTRVIDLAQLSDHIASEYVDAIVTTTNASEPLLHTLPSVATVIMAIGAYTSAMAEISPRIVRQLPIVVDTLQGCQTEAGDLVQAGIDFQQTLELERIHYGHFQSSQSVLFKSVGSAVWDLAAAQCALEIIGAQPEPLPGS